MRRARLALAGLALLPCACGGLGGEPPSRLPVIKGADGREYQVLDRGAYKAYYGEDDRLQRIEYDSNGDGRPDQVAHHAGRKLPGLIEVDENFDGASDRWEEYDETGRLTRVGVSRRGDKPDLWQVLGPDNQPARREYDDDGDGRVDRSEVLAGGRLQRLEIDGDRDGRVDRWQHWREGRLASEDLDTDGDGRPDRRLSYGAGGRLEGLERLAR